MAAHALILYILAENLYVYRNALSTFLPCYLPGCVLCYTITNHREREKRRINWRDNSIHQIFVQHSTTIHVRTTLTNSKKNKNGVIVQAPNEAQIMDLFDTDSSSIDYKKVTVPISITLFVIVSYVFLGGYLFKTLEGWTLLDGIYFCLITLLTIGLGDFVPGNSISVENSNEYVLAIVAFYILMGISLLSMCINLMQEEVLAKIKKLGVRLGIVEDPNYW